MTDSNKQSAEKAPKATKSTKALKSLPGFRDFYPQDYALRDHIFTAWKDAAEGHGFLGYDGPPLESLELYTRKSGEEIVGQLYHFTDKGEREVAMRPELTPTLARMAGARQRDYKKPMKWFSIPQLFRYERQQKGRLREHFQWNCDIIGEESLAAEAELISTLICGLCNAGLKKEEFVLRVSDRTIWLNFLDENNVSEDDRYTFFQALDKIDRSSEEDTRKKLGGLADKTFALVRGETSNARLDELQKRLDEFGLGEVMKVDLSIVRGLAYYTGVVFEVHDSAGEYRAIAGGGRYDNLLKLVSGNDIPALGFGMGDVVLSEMLKDKGRAPETPKNAEYYVVIAKEDQRPAAMKLVADLRRGGCRVDYGLTPAKVGKQFQAGQDRGASFAVVVDERLSAEGVVGLKDLNNREQRDVKVNITEGKIDFKTVE